MLLLVQPFCCDYVHSMKPDWINSNDYLFTEKLNQEQWAWEFLRRNPDYCNAWQKFWQTWQELEASYGKAPHRDFNAWKLDPRAYVVVSNDEAGDCRVDHDKVLIECHLGACWGFYKFPVDPALNDPVSDGKLTWREVSVEMEPLTEEDEDFLGRNATKIALGFDLSLPLKEQLERAKRLLQITQYRAVRSGITFQLFKPSIDLFCSILQKPRVLIGLCNYDNALTPGQQLQG